MSDLRPEVQQFEQFLGAHIELTYTVKDADDVAVDLTGATHKMLLKANRTDADEDALAEFTIDETDAATGVMVATLAGEETAELSPGVYIADHRVVIPAPSTAEGEWVVARFTLTLSYAGTRSVA